MTHCRATRGRMTRCLVARGRVGCGCHGRSTPLTARRCCPETPAQRLPGRRQT
jgi:hypothetical protein